MEREDYKIKVTFIVRIGRNAKEWKHNNDSPRLSVDAKVVAKRSDMHSSQSGEHHSTYTHYLEHVILDLKEKWINWINNMLLS